ncbi:MAG: rod shape-determining protein MreC [Muribaculaceae bacterium]|nr:rod shape-determining protein MreC [Muribaculaceae bacterium]
MLFMLYVLLSCIMLFSGNLYQQSIYLTSASSVGNAIYSAAQGVTGYFHLRSINSDLQQRNAALETEVLNLRHRLADLKSSMSDSIHAGNSEVDRFRFISATVINNSTHKPRNYFTINRGSQDGIQSGMGVVDHNGIVGIVGVTGKHTARIVSVLNANQHFSVKVKGTPHIGTLSWKEGNASIAYVEELPRHVKYHVGDTIVTSGYSTTFPEGIPVGYVMGQVSTADDNFYTVKVRLASDFPTLSTVRVLSDRYKAETDSLTMFDESPNN